MRSSIGRRSTALTVVALAATAVAGGALAAIATHSMATATTAKITATETNYKIALSRSAVAPGTVTFTVHNHGAVAHKFGVKGAGFSKSIPGLIQPGQTKSLTVTLKKGSYTVYCALHISSGMKTTLRVGQGPGTTTGGTTHTGTTYTYPTY